MHNLDASFERVFRAINTTGCLDDCISITHNEIFNKMRNLLADMIHVTDSLGAPADKLIQSALRMYQDEKEDIY